MPRKTRRKIQRRKRKSKGSKSKHWFFKWSDRIITNRFTRVSTVYMMVTESLFLWVCAIWASIEIFVRFPELVERLEQVGVLR